jgi:hypothetical protein
MKAGIASNMTVRRAWRLGPLALLLLTAVLPATAQMPDCTYNAETHSVTSVVNNSLSVHDGRIFVGGKPCGDATVFNTDVIRMIDPNQFVAISGVLAPGFTPESEGQSEIEVSIESGLPLISMLLDSTAQPDVMILGADGLNSNADQDMDVTVSSSDWTLRLHEGEDFLTAEGGSGTGAPYAGAMNSNGGGGADRIVLEQALWRAFGGAGADRVIGGRQLNGRQDLEGGGGRDVLKGGPGRDYLLGGPGRDKLFGGPGRDTCSDRVAVFRSCEVIFRKAGP